MGLRDDQVALTRRTIIDAVVALTGEPGAGAITVAEVSRRSGVSPATIYRHFPGRDHLIGAAATDRVTIGLPESSRSEWNLADERAHRSALWAELAGNLELTRQASVTEAGRELRRARFERVRPLYDTALARVGVDPGSDDARRFIACANLLSSGHALLELHDRQGLPVDEAVATASWAIDQLARSIGVEPAELRFPIGDLADDHEEARPA